MWNRRCSATSSLTASMSSFGIAQRLHPLARHPRPDRVVMVEGRALARLVAARARLADVVEQRRQAHAPEVERRSVRWLLVRRPHVLDDRDRVRQHVLVTMDRVVLEPHRRQLRQEVLGEAGLVDEEQAGRRMVEREQLVELVADALAGHDLEPSREPCRGLHQLVGRLQVVAGDEARRAQHPQRIVAEADLRRRAACAAPWPSGRRRRRTGRPAPVPRPVSPRAPSR